MLYFLAERPSLAKADALEACLRSLGFAEGVASFGNTLRSYQGEHGALQRRVLAVPARDGPREELVFSMREPESAVAWSLRKRTLLDRLRSRVRTGDDVFDAMFAAFGDARAILMRLTPELRDAVERLAGYGVLERAGRFTSFIFQTEAPDLCVPLVLAASETFAQLASLPVAELPERFVHERDPRVRCALIRVGLADASPAELRALVMLAGADKDAHVRALAAGAGAVSLDGADAGAISVATAKDENIPQEPRI